MPTPEKAKTIEELEAKLSSASSAVLADFRGLSVGQVTKLRRKLLEVGVDYKVYKNTLIRIAAGRVGVNGLDHYLEGPTALAFGHKDPVAPARILVDFAKETKILAIKGGILKGSAIGKEQVMQLAALPSREVLIGTLLGVMQSPMAGLVNVLSGPARKLVWTLEAVRKQKEEAGGGASAVEAQ
ncbi:MAG: 50S ribosomal protein L10 [Clostridia bacterium]|nr:50S ribosomal protein L10 [Clostridia bacterium]